MAPAFEQNKRRAIFFALLLLHQIAAYIVVRFCVPLTAMSIARMPYVRSGVVNWIGFLFDHLLLFSVLPAFLIAMTVNRILKHRPAVYVWVIPLVVFAYEFIFASPTVYPTMIRESDFATAFRQWIGDGFKSPVNAYYQIKFTAPVYVAVAYSLGAWLALRSRRRTNEATVTSV